MRSDAGLYERISLEAFQAGLSWLTVLRKRAALRSAFAGFDPAVVSGYGPAEVAQLLADPALIRHRGKVEAAIAGARATVALGAGGLGRLVWSYAPPPGPAPRTMADVPARTEASAALAAALRRHGFRFVGPVSAHALMQACGLVNEHLQGCAVRG